MTKNSAAFDAAVSELKELCSDIEYAREYGREESLPGMRLLLDAGVRRVFELWPDGSGEEDDPFPTPFQQPRA